MKYSNLLTSGDFLVLFCALLVVMGLYYNLLSPSQLGTQATVLISGKPWKTFDLGINQEISVPGNLGQSRIHINDGRVRFINSPCNSKLCILQDWLRYTGELGVCLPNRISVQVLGSNPKYDTINF